ncbi:UNVERIFIED_CONTAM: hypothetical protein RMT77_000368 [Armadillidium vulgare]
MPKNPTAGKAKILKKAVEKVIISDSLKTTIPAGLALPGPPLGPLLGQRGINIAAFCKDFNNRTSIYKEGVPLPCKIKVNPDRSYDLSIYKPPPMYFLLQSAGIQRGAMRPGAEEVGKITIKHIYEIAKIEKEDPRYKLIPLPKLCEILISSAHSIGIEVVRDIDLQDYGQYLEEKALLVEEQLKELQEKREAKLLRK